MKHYFLVNNGEARAIDRDELNTYPFVSTYNSQGEAEPFSEDWHHYESAGTEWCVAYAESDEEAVALADDSHYGLVARENVWCEIRQKPYEARA
ncbi:hypothetical protein [Desulfobulbus elongatus]|uniref:hypothetical protein n=1 Tax=Desulfobulbus elongatus TaxID=53332 RepID=UPI00048928CB|nr:hypothetical protein [Desulfobulbus elongatus]